MDVEATHMQHANNFKQWVSSFSNLTLHRLKIHFFFIFSWLVLRHSIHTSGIGFYNYFVVGFCRLNQSEKIYWIHINIKIYQINHARIHNFIIIFFTTIFNCVCCIKKVCFFSIVDENFHVNEKLRFILVVTREKSVNLKSNWIFSQYKCYLSIGLEIYVFKNILPWFTYLLSHSKV